MMGRVIFGRRKVVANVIFILLAMSPEFCLGQNTSTRDDSIEALAGKWDIQCSERGCLMFTDVLVGIQTIPPISRTPSTSPLRRQ